MKINFQLSNEVSNAIDIARSLAKENLSETIKGEHIFLALLNNEIGFAPDLVQLEKDVNYLKDWITYRIEQIPKSPVPISTSEMDNSLEKLFEVADLIKFKLEEDLITPRVLFMACLRKDVIFNENQLKSLPIIESDLIQMATSISDEKTKVGNKSKSSNQKHISNVLEKYCVDKTQEAHNGELDIIIGREDELRRIKEIIARRTKPNVLIIGEPGVGKSSLVDGFANDLIKDYVPTYLSGYSIFELDLGTLIAGASYKGEVEDRLKKIITKVKSREKIILFIDEIHLLLDPNSGFSGAANLLKPELARGAITLIGATTNEEYRKYIDKDEAFSRRFAIIQVDEPESDVCFQMLLNILPYYEEHHSLKISNEAIKASISLSKRYFKERKLPDSSIDLVDQTMSAIRMMEDNTLELLETFKIETQENSTSYTVSDFQWLKRKIDQSISLLLISQIKENQTFIESPSENTKTILTYLDGIKDIFESRKEIISELDIQTMVSQKTNIPLGKLQKDEREKLLELENILKKRVVGQDQAIHTVSEAIRESRAGLTPPGQPIGSFFFMGPTGTGKTELAKTLASFLFNDENAIIRFDMSEFKEEHSVALLYGAPPGYVGYEEGGMLVNKIRQKPYSIVLFDEIEKAHKSVFDLFLQILDEGKLSDRLGKVGDFSDAIILFTSNIGSDFIINSFDSGELPDHGQLLDQMSGHFRPEFLARITELVPFAPINENILITIFDIQMKSLLKSLEGLGIELEINEEVKAFIANKDFNPKYGARPIKGKIRTYIRRPLSRKIISGEVKNGDTVKINLRGEDIHWIISQ
jgi:ATP-dependent Clp protease ATP-binding subunit ClpA